MLGLFFYKDRANKTIGYSIHLHKPYIRFNTIYKNT